MRFARFIAFFTVVVCLVSCSRDPKKVRQSYLESGTKYFDRGKYKEASIMYRNAIRTDPKFGEAYYHLALTELKLQQIPSAVPALRRAIELLPPKTADYTDSNVKLAEILLMAAQAPEMGDRNVRALEEVRSIRDLLLKQNPNSFDGTKLQGELDLSDAMQFAGQNKVPESKAKMEEAIAFGQHSVAAFTLLALAAVGLLTGVTRWYAARRAQWGKAMALAGPTHPRKLVLRTLAVLIVMLFSKVLYLSSLNSYYTFYLIETFGVSIQGAQVLLFVFLAAVAAGRSSAGRWSTASARSSSSGARSSACCRSRFSCPISG